MSARRTLKPEAVLDDLKAAARLVNAMELRSADERAARTLNACEQAIRDGVALIEEPHLLFEAVPLAWGVERLCGAELLVGRGLGLKYCVAKIVDAEGWSWTLGSGAGPVEPTEEAAMAACQADFTEKLRASIRPLASI
ncbi:hypothetical protein D3C71_250190 [compost metagenome]